MTWIVLFIVIVVLGAISGGKSFGETISNGIGCLVLLAVGFFFLAAISGS